MTEAEWLTATYTEPMLEFLRGKASDRKLRLFGVACCRSMFATVTINPWDEHAVMTAERYADGVAELIELAEAVAATTSDWTAAFACAEAASVEGGFAAAQHASDNAAWEVGSQVASRSDADDVFDDEHPIRMAAQSAERATQSRLLRDVFGNPFRPVVFDPAWRSEPVSALAAGIYTDQAFDRLPILADALEEAGCDHADILNHCRGPGPHVKGCWVVDLVLGKG
jgi:hypothetical protein